MRHHTLLLASFCSAASIILSTVIAVPLPANNQELDVLQIPLANGKEIDVLTLGSKDQEQAIAERNKRTIGLLRELFPDITKNGASETQIDLSAINKQLEETIRVARQVKEAEAAAQAVANLQEQQKQQQQSATSSNQQPKLEESIQLSFNNEVLNSNENAKPVSNDLQSSESKSPAIDDLSLDSNEDQADLDDRNKSNIFKRFLSLGGGGGLAGSASGTNANVNAGAAGGPGGSGNFLFDIVRLFSGSVQTQNRDEAANSPKNNIGGSNDDNDSNNAADGYTEGIPGPVTRLVVLANRGLANLVQDMILRVAATSEKFVNFNAKLITALI